MEIIIYIQRRIGAEKRTAASESEAFHTVHRVHEGRPVRLMETIDIVDWMPGNLHAPARTAVKDRPWDSRGGKLFPLLRRSTLRLAASIAGQGGTQGEFFSEKRAPRTAVRGRHPG